MSFNASALPISLTQTPPRSSVHSGPAFGQDALVRSSVPLHGVGTPTRRCKARGRVLRAAGVYLAQELKIQRTMEKKSKRKSKTIESESLVTQRLCL